jgi:hypothetical protein
MRDAHAGIVRVLRDGKAVGLGFVVGRRQILTCAHVINTVLSRDRRSPDQPSGADEFDVDFPFAPEPWPRRFASVVAWSPEPGKPFDSQDVAVVALTEDPPPGTESLSLAHNNSTGAGQVQMWGPTEEKLGGNVSGTLMGAADHARVQVDQHVVGVFKAQGGFSGGPVWRPGTCQVVGMLQAAAQDGHVDVYALNPQVLIEALSEVLPPANNSTISSSPNTWIKIRSDGSCWTVESDDETGELTEWNSFDPNPRWKGFWDRQGNQISIRVNIYQLTAKRVEYGLYRGKETGSLTAGVFAVAKTNDFVVAGIRHPDGAGVPIATGIWVKVTKKRRTSLLELKEDGVFRERPLFGGGNTWRDGTWSTLGTNTLRTEIESEGHHCEVTARSRPPNSAWEGTERRDGNSHDNVLLAPVAVELSLT